MQTTTTTIKTRKASYKTLLLKKRQELLASIRSEPEALAVSLKTPDEVEFAVKTAEQDVTARTASLRTQTLREVENALKRVSRGSYGVCEMCGEDISPLRLKAIPWARCCVTCEELRSRN